MVDQFSIQWWQELCESRLAAASTFATLVGVPWLQEQYTSLRIATSQTEVHPLLRVVCAGDGTALRSVEAAFAALAPVARFDQRVASVRSASGDESVWAKWNEIRSAALFAAGGCTPVFSDERGAALVKAPDFTFDWKGSVVGVEIATVSDTQERVGNRKKQIRELQDRARRIFKEERKLGWPDGCAVGATVIEPPRFAETEELRPGDVRVRESVWRAVRYAAAIKQGSQQLDGCAIKILHVISDDAFFNHFDFQPEFFLSSDGLRHRSSGRIYNAYFGIKGQPLFWHHFVGHPLKYGVATRRVEQQVRAGRFVDRTSLSACIWTMHEHDRSGQKAMTGNNVLYAPVAGAATPIPEALVGTLDDGMHFDRRRSIADHVQGFTDVTP